MPLLPLALLIDIDDIQLLIHPQLMHKISDQHGPVLRRVRILADFLGDHFPESRFFGEPFPAHAGDGVPANLHRAERAVDARFARGYYIWFGAEAEGVFEGEFAFE